MLDNLLRDRIVAGHPYVVIDTETESLNLITSRPWQVSWLVVEGKRIVKTFDKFPWWEDLKISEGAAKVTRFNFDAYKKKAEPAKDIYELLGSYLFNEDYLVVGQNLIPFDSYQIKNWQLGIGKTRDFSYLNRTYDTLALARSYKKGFKPPQNLTSVNILAWQYKMLSFYEKTLKCSLGVLCKDFSIDYDSTVAHDGLYDIFKTKEVFEKLIWGLEI